MSFFDRYPRFQVYRTRITPESTPDLYEELTLVELNRLDLMQFMGGILTDQRPPETESHVLT